MKNPGINNNKKKIEIEALVLRTYQSFAYYNVVHVEWNTTK